MNYDLSRISHQKLLELCELACINATAYIQTPEGEQRYEQWKKEHQATTSNRQPTGCGK